MDGFATIEEILEDIRIGKVIILVDDPKRENEGDFFIPAANITPEIVNFMLHNGRGILCVAITQNQAHQVGLSSMVPRSKNTETTQVNFSVSVNARKGISSGVSTYDRAKTIQVVSDPNTIPSDLTRPGHIFPLIAHSQGLQARHGHTEAAITLASLSGNKSSGVICEILNSDGTMAKLPELITLAKKHNLKIASINDLRKYIDKNPINNEEQSSVIRTACAELPTEHGDFEIKIYRSAYDGLEHTALIYGKITSPMLTRVHSQCLTGDTFNSLLCDCGEQLQVSMNKIKENGSGILLYLNQEGRGIGLSAKVQAYSKQKTGLDTVDANIALGFKADERDYSVAADILKGLGISEIDLLTNNPKKQTDLTKLGIKIHRRVPIEVKPTDTNRRYLRTKKNRLGHQLDYA